MKKIAAALLILGCAGTALSAQTFSIGGGFTGSNNWIVDNTNYANTADRTEKNIFNNIDLGGFLSFDAVYGEFGVIFEGGKVYTGNGGMADAVKLGLALFAKYPFQIGAGGLSLAPVLGFQYDIVLAAKTPEGAASQGGTKYEKNTQADLNILFLMFGANARYFLTKKFFLDIQLLWGAGFDSTIQKLMNASNAGVFTHCNTIKLGMGYRF